MQLEVTAINLEARAFGNADIDIGLDLGEVLFGDDGTKIGCRIKRGTNFEAFNARNKRLDQTIRRCFTNRNRNRNRHAALARRAIACAHQRVDDLIHIGIGHDDHVVLRATKALHALTGCCATGVDIFGNRRGADKADGLHIRIIKQRIHRFFVALHDIEDACGQTGFNK